VSGEYEYADGAYEDDIPVPEYPSLAPFGFPMMLPSENGPLIVGSGASRSSCSSLSSN
jgi:hypothetical protein